MAYGPNVCQYRVAFLPKLRLYPAKKALALVSHQCMLCCVQIEHDKASIELHVVQARGGGESCNLKQGLLCCICASHCVCASLQCFRASGDCA